MAALTMGVIGHARKENELRAPIHPAHLDRIDADLRQRMLFEAGYGVRFGYSDDWLRERVGHVVSREQLFERADIVLMPKPTEADFDSFRQGQVLWGWPHCVQGPAITQLGIDKRMTMIAWEAMHLWRGDAWDLHVFHLNNEIAGYAGVLHALQLKGVTGHYGRPLKACVIGFGSVGRGAIHALQGLGVNDVTLFTQRPGHTVGQPIPSVKHWQYARTDDEGMDCHVVLDSGDMPMPKALGHFDIIVNCALQDTDAPMMYLRASELHELRPGTVIVDVSCDEGMGFSFAKPTSFESPTFMVGDQVLYYAVDHTPSYLWGSATETISEALLPFVPVVMGGPAAWDADATIRRSIELREGRVVNPKILSFQGRSEAFPHEVIDR
jgi:alanine dehydrogenase